MNGRARIGDILPCSLQGTVFGVDHIEMLDPRTTRQDFAGKVAPAAAEVGDSAEKIVRQMRGEKERAVVDPVPAEKAGLADPAAVGHRARLCESLPKLGRGSLALGQPEDTTMELRQ